MSYKKSLSDSKIDRTAQREGDARDGVRKPYGFGGAFIYSGSEPSPARLDSKKCGIGRTYKNNFQSHLCALRGQGAGLSPCPRRCGSHTACIAMKRQMPSPSVKGTNVRAY